MFGCDSQLHQCSVGRGPRSVSLVVAESHLSEPLVDPGSELRAEIVLIAETRVCYGLVGLTPQEG